MAAPRYMRIAMALLAALWLTATAAQAAPFRVTRMADGLREPWGLAFMPDGRFLVTERGGTLRLFAAGGGKGARVAGLPKVAVTGQGGLLDVMVPGDFAASRRVWLSYAARPGRAPAPRRASGA